MRRNITVWELSLYDVCLECEGDASFVVAEGVTFVGDGCASTDTLLTDVVYQTTLRSGSGGGETTVDCGVNYDGNMGTGEGEVSGV